MSNIMIKKMLISIISIITSCQNIVYSQTEYDRESIKDIVHEIQNVLSKYNVNQDISVNQICATMEVMRHDYGQSIDSPDRKGNRPLTDAVKKGDIISVLSLCFLGAKTEIRDLSGNTPLISASSSYGGTQIAISLCLMGANINNKHSMKFWPPIIYAIQRRNATLTQYFMDNNAKLDIHDEEYRAILMKLASYKNDSPNCATIINMIEEYCHEKIQ